MSLKCNSLLNKERRVQMVHELRRSFKEGIFQIKQIKNSWICKMNLRSEQSTRNINKGYRNRELK